MAGAATGDDADPEFKIYTLRQIEPVIKKITAKLRANIVELRLRKDNIERIKKNPLTSDGHLADEYEAAISSAKQVAAAVGQIQQVRQQVQADDQLTLDCRWTMALDGLTGLLVELLSENDGDDVTSVADESPQSHVDAANFPSTATVCSNVEPTDEQACISQSDSIERKHEQVLATQLHMTLVNLNAKLAILFWMIEHRTTNFTSFHENAPENDQLQQKAQFAMPNSLKLLMIPFAGAVIGTAIAGPVGLIAGLKMGKIAAVGGGLLGLTGGTLLKEKTDIHSPTNNENEELQLSSANELSETNPMQSVM